MKRIQHESRTFPIGTSGTQEINITTYKDMNTVEAVGFVEVAGSAQQYRLGLKNPLSGSNIIDPIAKQLLIASSSVKNDDRYERTPGVEANGKQITVIVVFDSVSTAAVTLNLAVVQIKP